MVHIELDSEISNFKGIIIDDFDSESLGSGIRRELSFSRWCDDDNDGCGDGRVHLDQQLDDDDDDDVSVEEDTDFELPFIIQKNEVQVQGKPLDRERLIFEKFQQQKSELMSGAIAMDDETVHRRGNGSEKYVPFDIEDIPERGTVGGDSYISVGSDGSLDKVSQNAIPAANILKTLFFILVWYTFSLFLTL